MRVLVFNAGSASLKCDLLEIGPESQPPSAARNLRSITIEQIGKEDTTLSRLEGKDVADKQPVEARSYQDAAALALERFSEFREAELVGHRVVHGGPDLFIPTAVDDEVLSQIEQLDALAPLHNRPAADVIRRTRELLPRPRHIAVFDTAFHRSLPPDAYTYALPKDLASKHRIRRYGFHGLSHRYLVRRYGELTGNQSPTVVTLHLESGSSACAIRNGSSVETSMGFTPLEGLVMGMRSGDLDPALVGFLANAEKLDLPAVEELLNKKSGLLGLSGVSHDTRELDKHRDNSDVQLALDVFVHRVVKYIGGYLAVLNGAEAVVFGGGIGEDSPALRAQICSYFGYLDLDLDKQQNDKLINQEGRITTDDSRLHAWVITTEEAAEVAWEAAHECR